ncbi:hypothetical protein D9M71_687660 [compost metagenome]
MRVNLSHSPAATASSSTCVDRLSSASPIFISTSLAIGDFLLKISLYLLTVSSSVNLLRNFEMSIFSRDSLSFLSPDVEILSSSMSVMSFGS